MISHVMTERVITRTQCNVLNQKKRELTFTALLLGSEATVLRIFVPFTIVNGYINDPLTAIIARKSSTERANYSYSCNTPVS
jgi:hypothetical protein